MSTSTIVGFVLTLVVVVVFMAVSWWQLVRIRRTARDEITVRSDGETGPES